MTTVTNPTSSKLNDSSVKMSTGGPQYHPHSLIFNVNMAHPAKISQKTCTGADLTASHRSDQLDLILIPQGTLLLSAPLTVSSEDHSLLLLARGGSGSGTTSSVSSVRGTNKDIGLTSSQSCRVSGETTARDRNTA
jgi:hypothetical protein